MSHYPSPQITPCLPVYSLYSLKPKNTLKKKKKSWKKKKNSNTKKSNNGFPISGFPPKKALNKTNIYHRLKKTGTTPGFRTVARVTESSVEPSTHLTLTSNDFMNFYTNKNWRHHTDAPQSNSWHFTHLHFTQQSMRGLTPCAPRGPWGHIWKKTAVVRKIR